MLAATACGGSGHSNTGSDRAGERPAPPPPKASAPQVRRFARRTAPGCRRIRRSASRHAAAETTRGAKATLAAIRPALRELTAVRPPADRRAAYQAALGTAQGEYALIQTAVNAIEKKGADPGRALAAVRPQLRTHQHQLTRQFRKLGLAACAQGIRFRLP